MAIGDPGAGPFRDAVIRHRNPYIAAGIAPLITFRQEVVANSALQDRGGFDTATQAHFRKHLGHCDRVRRQLTYNPENTDLQVLIKEGIDPKGEAKEGSNPVSIADDVQMGSGGLFDLPFDLSGKDENIPMPSVLKQLSPNGILLLGLVDKAIVNWTRLNSGDRGRYITVMDSMRVYATYQEILTFLLTFGGDANRIDVAQLLPTKEPRGPENSPNRVTETVGDQTGGGTAAK